MKDLFMKVYIYVLLLFSLVNAVFLVFREQMSVGLHLISFFELMVPILSVCMIIYIVVDKLKKIYLILPIFYLLGYLFLALLGAVAYFQGVDPFLFLFESMFAYAASWFFYVVQVVVGLYLLRKC